jgi:3-oxoacyl-[acyl-carrier protein] reductase
MKTPLQGKVAVVTGGDRGIGAAIAARLRELEAQVVICARNQKKLEATAEKLGCRALSCDVTSLESVERLAKAVQQEFGGCDVLVNNAGVGSFSTPLHELPPEEWESVMNTNLRGVYYMIRAFAPLMIAAGRGDIVNISSLAGKNPLPNGAAYAASKWGLNGLSYAVAEELRRHNVRVSIVCPGSVDTSLSLHAGKDKSRMLQPQDVAHAVAAIVTQEPQSFISEVLVRPTQKP